MRKLAFNFIFLLLAATAMSQEVKRYFFTHYTTTHGLLANRVQNIAQDDQGYLWIATTNGLQRFDGHSFISFRHDPNNPYSIPENEVWQTTFDQQKNLWLVFANGKAAIFNTRTFQCREVKIDIPDDIIRNEWKKLFIDRKGNVMLIVPKLQLVTYNAATNSFSSKYNFIKTEPGPWMASDLTDDPATGKYYMASDSGLLVYNTKTNLLSRRGNNKDKDEVINAFGHVLFPGFPYIDKKRRFWFQNWYQAGAPSFYSFDLSNHQPYIDSLNVFYILRGYCEPKMFTEQPDGRLLITGTPMLAEYSEAEKKFIRIENSLMGTMNTEYQVILFSYSDKENNIWLCTRNDGLYKFNPSSQIFTSISHTNPFTGLPGQMGILGFTQLPNGDIITSPWGEGLMRYDSNMNRLPLAFKGVNEKNDISGWCAAIRHDGKMWLGLQEDHGNIMVYDIATGNTVQYKLFPRITVRQIVEDRQGNMWVGLHRKGLYKWMQGSPMRQDKFQKFHEPTGMINKLMVDSSGFLWVSAPPYGVYKINTATNEVIELLNSKSKPALPSDVTGELMQYNDSLVLIISKGLCIYNTKSKTLTVLDTKDGLPSTDIRSLQRDDAGYLWMGMVNGLCRLDMFKRTIVVFDRNDGMANDDFGFVASYRLRDGRMLFGTNRDFIVFDPKNLRNIPKPPDVHITEFKLSGKSMQLDSLFKLEEIELPYDNTAVIIDFSALSYLQTNKFAYYFMLEGVDKNWVRIETQPRANYPYLAPGTYHFKVRTRNTEGVLSEITELTIHVNPPFWQTWWFYSLLAMGTALVLFWLDRERMKRKEAIHRMRSAIAGNLHQDINTALNNINILSEMARRKADKEIEKSKEFIEQIHTKSHNMIIAMDDMLWSIDPQNDSMAKTVLRFKEYIAELNNRYGVNIEMTMEEKIKSLKLGMQFRHEAFILFKEFTEGVLKICMSDSKIHVGLHKQDLVYTMETRTHGCNANELRHLPERQDIAARLQTLRATSRVIALKETCVLELVISPSIS